MSIAAVRWTRSLKGLRSTQKLILFILADRAGEDGTCYPSLGGIAEDAGLDERTVNTALREMVDGGVISRVGKPGRSYTYTLHVGAEYTPPSTNVPPAMVVPPSTNVPPPPPTNEGGPPSTSAPRSYQEATKKRSNKNTHARKPKPQKLQFGKFGNVKMTQQEWDNLFADHPDLAQDAIDKLDSWLGAKGDKYKSHYMAIHSWVLRAVQEERQKLGGQSRASPRVGVSRSGNSYDNGTPRDYGPSDFGALGREYAN